MDKCGSSDKEILILLVEDHPGDTVLFMHACNSFLNVEVVTAGTVSNAVNYLDSYDFDIVFSDLNLFDSTGSESIVGILKKKPNIPVVAMTGLASDDVKEEVIKAGAKGLIPKSELSPQNLEKCISSLGFKLKTL